MSCVIICKENRLVAKIDAEIRLEGPGCGTWPDLCSWTTRGGKEATVPVTVGSHGGAAHQGHKKRKEWVKGSSHGNTGLNKRTWGLSRTCGVFRGRAKGGGKVKMEHGKRGTTAAGLEEGDPVLLSRTEVQQDSGTGRAIFSCRCAPVAHPAHCSPTASYSHGVTQVGKALQDHPVQPLTQQDRVHH